MTTLERALVLARGAGEILLDRYGTLHRADAARKAGARRDLVSEADLEAERFLLKNIPEEDDVLAEEGGKRDSGAARLWVVDPLDGTINFLHGIAFWAVSLGVVENGRLVAGVVHAPALRQTFTAEAGGGCFRNGERVAVSDTGDLADAILATGFAYRLNDLEDDNLENWTALSLASAGLRRMGSASLDLAYTACGNLDGFFELHLEPWDVCAGILLVREAGGVVTDFRGSDDVNRLVFGRNLVATNGRLHAAVRASLAPLRAL